MSYLFYFPGDILFFCLLLFVINYILYLLFPDKMVSKFELKEIIYIKSFVSKNNFSGNFFLGCGSFGETEYYYFFKKSDIDDRAVIKDKIESGVHVHIIECDEEPRIEKYSNGDSIFDSYYYKVYIPENSINYNFNESNNFHE